MRVMIAMGIALLGCEPPSTPRVQGPARSTKLNEPPRDMPARSPSSVGIYQVRQPEDPFIEVYQIADLGQNENVALESLRRSSALLGCDGLIVGSSRIESVIAGSIQQVSLSGTCIMFVRDPGTWRELEPEPKPEPEPEPKSEPKSEPSKPRYEDSKACREARAKVYGAKDPRERARFSRMVQSSCYPK